MNAVIDLTGRQYGRLTVLERAENKGENKRWLCACRCGNKKIIYGGHLNRGATSSCGCFAKEKHLERTVTHGLTKTPEYVSWISMKNRCFNKNSDDYRNYGERGITVCDRWKSSFENFIEDMGARPKGRFSIDRISNDGNYEPSNCRWATDSEQANNKRQNKVIEFNGTRLNLSQWSRKMNLGRGVLWKRLYKLNWPIPKALTQPMIKDLAAMEEEYNELAKGIADKKGLII